MRDLAEVIDRWRSDAAALRRNGFSAEAATLERCASETAESNASEWLTWLSEQEALDRSARSPDFFRVRRSAWEADGYAKRVGRRWFYRRCIVPRSRLSSIQRAEAAQEMAG
jgi:hypothetical protein